MHLNINANSIETYIKIKNYINNGNPVFSKDNTDAGILAFQRSFTNFYRVRCKNDWFYQVFEAIRLKRDSITGYEAFTEALEKLADANNRYRIEFSFSSKMIATLYDDMPIWDSLISQKLLIPAPPSEWANDKKIAYTKYAYKQLISFYSRLYNHSEIWTLLINTFDNSVKDDELKKISDYRKIDFVLWSDEIQKDKNNIDVSEIDSLIQAIILE